MESSLKKLGSSLKVPIVQELAKQNPAAVPSRYIRHDHDQHIPSRTSSLLEIPVIDFRKLFDSDFMDSELTKLHNACKEWGFFQLINHGVEPAVIEKMKLQIKGFFDLPVDEKMKFGQKEGDIEGYGQAFVVSEEQKLDWADLLYIVTLPTHIRKPHLIPKLPSTFRNAMESYSSELKVLSMKILNQMAKALRMKDEEMEAVFGGGMQSMRMNYYPPCPEPELVTGLNPHSDGSGMTILLQVNETNGLHVKKDGIWIPISPLPNSFTLNIGDMLEIVTNGIYRSVEHKASVDSVRERISIATFVSAKLEGELGPSPSLVRPKTPAKFKTTTTVDFLRALFSKELNGKSSLTDNTS